MDAIILAAMLLQTGSGIATNSKSQPAVSVAIPAHLLPRATPEEPELGPGRYELVVHWPESAKADYRRSFKSGVSCLKARAAVLEEHRARMVAIAVNMSNRGTILAAELEAPYAVCIPLEG
jgi:hypothetical protein